MSNFMQWMFEKLASRKEKKARNKQEKLERMSCRTINVVEFNGKLYVAYDDIPVVPVSSLSVEVEKVVAAARQDYLVWRNKFGESYGV